MTCVFDKRPRRCPGCGHLPHIQRCGQPTVFTKSDCACPGFEWAREAVAA